MPRNLAEIETYWQSAAASPVDKDGLKPTARDPHLQIAVEQAMLKWIWPAATLIDIGCGDGASTLKFAEIAGEVCGVDYVQSFVDEAVRKANSEGREKVRFLKGNVLDLLPLKAECGLADIVTSIRCLINLPNWDLQRQAIDQIASLLGRGGLFVLSEGWFEGWEGLNRARLKSGLPAMTMVDYNQLIKRSEFERHILQSFDIVSYENLGFYLFMSRIFQASLVAPELPTHTSKVNSVAADLLRRGLGSGAFEDMDYAGVYVLRKR